MNIIMYLHCHILQCQTYQNEFNLPEKLNSKHLKKSFDQNTNSNKNETTVYNLTKDDWLNESNTVFS